MRVRRGIPEDMAAVRALLEELDRLQGDWRVFPPRSGFEEEVLRRYRASFDDERAALLLAEDERGVAGMAFAEVLTPSSFSDEEAVEVSSVVVRPDRRGSGAGRALVSEAAAFAAERGVRRVVLKTFAGNRRALDFWVSLGFEPRVVPLTSPVERLRAARETSPGGPGLKAD